MICCWPPWLAMTQPAPAEFRSIFKGLGHDFWTIRCCDHRFSDKKKTSKTWRSLENIRISVYHHASAPLHTWLWPPWRRSAAAVPGERLSDGIKKNDIWPARQVKNVGSRWHFPRKISGFGTLQAEIRRLNAIVGCLANQELRVSTSRWWFQQQLWICELHEVGVTLLRRPQPTVVMNISPRKKKNQKKTGSRWWFLGDKIHNYGFF